jgi:hypothetical protein
MPAIVATLRGPQTAQQLMCAVNAANSIHVQQKIARRSAPLAVVVALFAGSVKLSLNWSHTQRLIDVGECRVRR